LVVGDARVVIPKLNYSFNFMFIDADKRQYLEYLKLAEPLLKEGSIIVADNVKIFRNILSDYLDYVRGSKKYSSYSIDVGDDAIEVSKKLF
jgi:Predicted O-methyltransferase